MCACQFNCAIHRNLGIDVPQPEVAVPALKATDSFNFRRLGLEVDITLTNVFDQTCKTIDAMGIHTVAASFCHQLSRKVGGRIITALFYQHASKLGFQVFKRNALHGSVSNWLFLRVRDSHAPLLALGLQCCICHPWRWLRAFYIFWTGRCVFVIAKNTLKLRRLYTP